MASELLLLNRLEAIFAAPQGQANECERSEVCQMGYFSYLPSL